MPCKEFVEIKNNYFFPELKFSLELAFDALVEAGPHRLAGIKIHEKKLAGCLSPLKQASVACPHREIARVLACLKLSY